MQTRWQDFFEKAEERYASPLEYAVEHWSYNLPLYHHIRALVAPSARILDIGCGLGFSDIYLQSCGYSVTGIDYDQEVVKKALRNAEAMQSDVKFEYGDATNLAPYYGAYDLVYSVGVVEHFDRHQTVELIREQAKCARWVVTLIPTRFVVHSAGHTDERLYSIQELCRITREAGLVCHEAFGYGDVTASRHLWTKRLLPFGLYRLLQNRCSYAMGIVCIGRRPSEM